ncbi:MAG: deoxyhypusine synthase family protein, partial [Thermoplasmata archaeon]|nr:deoxyhypusine synthase family protein [Thermoplasmata archaeon]
LAKNTQKDQRGILKSAYLRKVPVYVPAFTDSELGLDFGIYMRRMRLAEKKPVKYDAFADLEDYTERVLASERLGILTIGGGVPRNWAQQVGPYLDIIDKRIGEGGGFKRFDYAVRICPEPVHWGGLSGCTYSEGVSWGKIRPRAEGGKYVEVMSDATIAWPIIIKAVMERLG